MQNLRARPYDPLTGRFIGLDPFAGNMQDPQSLHKYAYVHGDPIGDSDPSGLSPGLARMVARIGLFVAYRIVLGWAAEYTLRKAYEKEVNRGDDVWFNLQIGRIGDIDLPPGGMQDQFKLKPDILDRDRHTFYEIKPSNPVGVVLGEAQLFRYFNSIAARWPTETNIRGNWNPSQIIYWIQVPNFLRDVADGRNADVLIELPLIILAKQHSPGLVVYDEGTLSLQAAAVALGTEAVGRYLLNLGKRLGKGNNIDDIADEVEKIFKFPQTHAPGPIGPVQPIGLPPRIAASVAATFGVGGIGGF